MKRIRFRHKTFFKPKEEEKYPANQDIKASEVRVIDENGQMLGVLSTFQAINLAKERGLDLVAVSPKAQPPVAKFLNYGSFKYQQEKALRKQKAHAKKVELKEIRVSPRISSHDLEVRLKQAEKFLKRGDKLSITVILKGRERQHPELAKDLIENFIKALDKVLIVKVEQEIKRTGANFSAIIYSEGTEVNNEEKKLD